MQAYFMRLEQPVFCFDNGGVFQFRLTSDWGDDDKID